LNLAAQLIRRLATDPVFRHQLNALEPGSKRAFLDANGFRGVTAEWLHSVAHGAFTDLTAENVAPEDAMLAVTTAATASVSVPASPQGINPAASALVPITTAPQALHPASASLVPITAAPQGINPAASALVPITAAPQSTGTPTPPQAPTPPATASDTKPPSKKS
jgi:phage tail tape-measure protein